MAPIQLRPRSASEIVDAAFQILRAHYAQFVMCSALAYTPWLIVELMLAGSGSLAATPSMSSSLVLVIGGWLMYALMSAVLIVCASQAYLGESVDVGIAVRRVLPRLPTVLLGAIVRYACILLTALTVVGPIYFAARLFALTPTIVLESESVRGALRRSSLLSAGRKWHVLNTLGLVAIIYWILLLGVQGAALWLGNKMLLMVVTAAFTIMVYPAVGITEALLYFDTRIKSEGLDIELMAGALDAPGAPAAS